MKMKYGTFHENFNDMQDKDLIQNFINNYIKNVNKDKC